MKSLHCRQKRIKLNLLFKPSYLNLNFALTLGYLNPVLNKPAQVLKLQIGNDVSCIVYIRNIQSATDYIT